MTDPHQTSALPIVTVLIVTWNGRELLRRTLTSVLAQTVAGAVEIIVVDNGSDDGTEIMLAREFPRVRRLGLGANHGFAVANNRGVELARSELVFLLNNDTVLRANCLAALLHEAAARPEYDVFVPEMVRLNEPDVVDNRGVFLDSTGHFRQLDAGAAVNPTRSSCEVFGGSGGALLVRTALLRRISLFDETLVTYLEDCDFAARARAAGARAWYVADASLLHEGSATARRIPDEKLFLIQRNMLVLWRRWCPFRPWRANGWAGLAYELLQLVKGVAAGRGALVWRAKWTGWRTPVSAPSDSRAVAAWVGVQSRLEGDSAGTPRARTTAERRA